MFFIPEVKLRDALNFNEAEIRLYIIDPIVTRLGYVNSDNLYLHLERKLNYPYAHIGRRSRKDVPLGVPDYIAGVKGARGSFIIEAKAGDVPIGHLEIEQAHSYAAHPEIGAKYFAICNGSEFVIYETLSGCDSDPIVRLSLVDLPLRFYEIENILSPENLERNCKLIYDKSLKLSQGLRSSISVTGGFYKIQNFNYRFLLDGVDCTEFLRRGDSNLSQIEQEIEFFISSFELRVERGEIRRGLDGRILAHFKFLGATIHNKRTMDLIGVSEMNFETGDEYISLSENTPTIFESAKEYSLGKGVEIPRLFGEIGTLETSVKGDILIRAAMYYDNMRLMGKYTSYSTQFFPTNDGRELKFESTSHGNFVLEAAV